MFVTVVTSIGIWYIPALVNNFYSLHCQELKHVKKLLVGLDVTSFGDCYTAHPGKICKLSLPASKENICNQRLFCGNCKYMYSQRIPQKKLLSYDCPSFTQKVVDCRPRLQWRSWRFKSTWAYDPFEQAAPSVFEKHMIEITHYLAG